MNVSKEYAQKILDLQSASNIIPLVRLLYERQVFLLSQKTSINDHATRLLIEQIQHLSSISMDYSDAYDVIDKIAKS